MNWLKKKVLNWLSLASVDDKERPSNPMNLLIGSSSYLRNEETPFYSEPLRLNIFFAGGGVIVETRRYDDRGDCNIPHLHIIPTDQDLGAGLAKIITMDSLRG
jgi:hypothetical protein